MRLGGGGGGILGGIGGGVVGLYDGEERVEGKLWKTVLCEWGIGGNLGADWVAMEGIA